MHKPQSLRSIIPRANNNAIHLLEWMLSFNPANRPSASQCLQHPFFQCFDILSLYGMQINLALSSNKRYNQTVSSTATPNRVSSGMNAEKKKNSSSTNVGNPFASSSNNMSRSNYAAYGSNIVYGRDKLIGMNNNSNSNGLNNKNHKNNRFDEFLLNYKNC